jgi:cobalt-zinc-cadmium efflux system outer membrane protein
MIEAVIAAARVRYEVGTSAQADVIRAQLQLSDLDHQVLQLNGRRRSATVRLLTLLDLPLDTNVPNVMLPESTHALTIAGSTAPPVDHPALVALTIEGERAEEEIRLAQAEQHPDIDLEAQYGFRPRQRDMFSVVARIELPLRTKQLVEPRLREAMRRRDAAKASIDELRRSITAAMAEAVVAHEEAMNQLKFHEEVLVPQSQLAFESTLAAYQTGKAPFEAMLSTETSYLQLRLEHFEFLLAHAQAVVSYEALQRGARSGGAIASPASAKSTGPTNSGSMGSMQ